MLGLPASSDTTNPFPPPECSLPTIGQVAGCAGVTDAQMCGLSRSYQLTQESAKGAMTSIFRLDPRATHLVSLVSLSGTSLGCFSTQRIHCVPQSCVFLSPSFNSTGSSHLGLQFQFPHPLKISNSSPTHVITSWVSLVVPLAGPSQGLPPTAAPRHSWPLPSCSLPCLRA